VRSSATDGIDLAIHGRALEGMHKAERSVAAEKVDLGQSIGHIAAQAGVYSGERCHNPVIRFVTEDGSSLHQGVSLFRESAEAPENGPGDRRRREGRQRLFGYVGAEPLPLQGRKQ
jgi:hypothetical protein